MCQAAIKGITVPILAAEFNLHPTRVRRIGMNENGIMLRKLFPYRAIAQRMDAGRHMFLHAINTDIRSDLGKGMTKKEITHKYKIDAQELVRVLKAA